MWLSGCECVLWNRGPGFDSHLGDWPSVGHTAQRVLTWYLSVSPCPHNCNSGVPPSTSHVPTAAPIARLYWALSSDSQ